jgi:hypothetical protein
MRAFRINSLSVVLLGICLLFVILNARPLTKKVEDYLRADEDVFRNYRESFKALSCRVMIYGKLRLMYEEERIDKYMNQTENKKEYIDLLDNEMYKLCLEKYSMSNVSIFANYPGNFRP